MQRRNNILRNLDWVATILYVVLVLMGWLNIYAAVYSDEHRNILDFSQRYGKQLVWIFFAFLMAIVILYSNDRIFPAFAYIFYGIILITLISTLLFGRVVNASKSWIPIGSFGLQPAEFAKIATALALAKLMSSYGFKLSGFWSYVKVAVIIGLPVGIILLQNDTGSALVFGALILVLYREGLPAWI
ncbi:MAG: rod shape-determining protein RodA, partial [Bacteroidales bacterium]|nr:rod shape-determining protein RodA [Bacteroidales bacterium]